MRGVLAGHEARRRRVGRLKQGAERELASVSRSARKRAAGPWAFARIDRGDRGERARRAEDRMAEERQRLRRRLPRTRARGAGRTGESISSAALAERISRWRTVGGDVTFLIGGADGLAGS